MAKNFIKITGYAKRNFKAIYFFGSMSVWHRTHAHKCATPRQTQQDRQSSAFLIPNLSPIPAHKNMKTTILTILLLISISALSAQSRYENSRYARSLEVAESQRANISRKALNIRNNSSSKNSAIRSMPRVFTSDEKRILFLKLCAENPSLPLAIASVQPATYSWFLLEEIKNPKSSIELVRQNYLKINRLFLQYGKRAN